MSKKKRIIFLALSIVVLTIFVVIPFGLAAMIYEDNFGSRYTSYEPMARSIDEFKDLQAERVTFPSNQGQALVGYQYYKNKTDAKGIVVIAHGLGGGGHNSYMDVADYFASQNYIVFAYDATGNDESEGSSVRGMPQGLIDLDYAIRYIKQTTAFDGLPLFLFGHSWGGYSAGSVLNLHPDVKAAVIVAGFNNSIDIIAEEGERIAGDSIHVLMPYIAVYERIKFGKYATYNCLDGFQNTDAGVMIIYSSDDEMISQEKSFDLFYDMYQTNARFQFVKYEDRGHNYVYYSDESRSYQTSFNTAFDVYVNSLPQLTAQLKADYFQEHLDKSMLFDLDLALMERIVKFYDEITN